jgi:glycosyltransferase involved in cell wall biosynthesis
MRVHHVITRLIVGGAQENTIASVLGLRKHSDLDVRLLAGPTEGAEGSLESTLDAATGCLVRIPTLIRAIRPLQDLRALRDLTRYFQFHRPDLVHTHSGKAGLLGRWAAHRARVPLIIHGIHGPSFGPFQGSLANFAFRRAEQFAGRRTHHFVVVADAMRQQYLAAGIGRPDQYSLIYSGFDLAPYLSTGRDPLLAQKLGLQADDFVVGLIARLFALKGHDDLIDAATEIVRRIPKARFLWVGDGPWRDRLEERIRATGLHKRFVLAGLIPPGDVPRHVGLMDCLVHLSRREGLPRALPQALAAGKPVVAYDCDGAGEVCRTDETGFLIPPGRLDALTSALWSLAVHPDLRHRLGETGRAWVRERFSIERLVEGQYRLYRQLQEARGSATSPRP